MVLKELCNTTMLFPKHSNGMLKIYPEPKLLHINTDEQERTAY